MSILDPKQDAAALRPIVEEALSQLGTEIVTSIAPALGQSLRASLAGLKITISIQITDPEEK